MEHYKISKLLNFSALSKFVTRKQIAGNDLSNDQYFMFRSDIFGCGDAYIALKRKVDLLVAHANENDETEKDVAFKNNVLFRSCLSKINSTLIDDAENLDIIMSTYNVLEHCHNYSLISGSLWNYYRDEICYDSVANGKSLSIKKN